MTVVIGGLVPRATATDLAGTQLETAYGVHALTVGSRSFVYVTGKDDDGLSAFELGAGGSLTGIQNIDDGAATGPLKLKGAAGLASATVGGTTFLYVAGSLDDGISVFRVNANGTLKNVQNVADTAALELNGIEGEMAVATLGNTSFLVATGDDDNGVSVFRIEADGTLTNTFNVTDAGALELDNAMDAAAAEVGGRSFVFVAGEDDNGLSAFELLADGTLVNTANVADNATLELQGAMGLATAKVGGTTYLLASGGYDDGLSVFSVSGTGQLTNVFNLSDSAARGLNGAQGLTTFTLGGETFVAVSGRDDDALSLFLLGAGGTLTDVTAVFDDAGLALDGTFRNAFASAGGNPFLLATGYNDNGVSALEIGGANDALTGTSGDDLLLGLGGNDTLDGGGGEDRMLGGSGGDAYLVDSAGDRVEEGKGGGIDTVRASVSFTLSADVENLVLLGGGAINGTGNTLANVLTGNDGANLLSGQGGNDAIDGAGGNDTVTGEAGADALRGGAGTDLLKGGDGADTLEGGAGNDTLTGGGGADGFVYASEGDSPAGSGRDVISDFAAGVDSIVLTAVDADQGQSGDQAFALDADGSFSAGEIRQTMTSGGLLLEMNTDADAGAEMAILVKKVTGPLAASDFDL